MPVRRIDDMVLRIMRALFAVGVFDHPPASDPTALTRRAEHRRRRRRSRSRQPRAARCCSRTLTTCCRSPAGQEIAVIGLAARPGRRAERSTRAAAAPRCRSSASTRRGRRRCRASRRAAQADGDVVTYAAGTLVADASLPQRPRGRRGGLRRRRRDRGQRPQSLARRSTRPASWSCLQPVAARDQDSSVAAVAKANPQHHRRAADRRPGRDAVAAAGQGRARDVVPGRAGRQRGRRAAVRRREPVGQAAVHLPEVGRRQPRSRPRRSSPAITRTACPHSTYSEGLLVGYRWYDAKHITPLFPFGFGLSYTSFKFSGLTVQCDRAGARCDVRREEHRRARRRRGRAALRRDPPAAREPPKQLKGYEKVTLEPGERRGHAAAGPAAFSYWNTKANGWQWHRAATRSTSATRQPTSHCRASTASPTASAIAHLFKDRRVRQEIFVLATTECGVLCDTPRVAVVTAKISRGGG